MEIPRDWKAASSDVRKGAARETKMKLHDYEPEGANGHMADMWVELPVTVMISMCISSAVGLVQSAIAKGAPGVVLPY